ncbi:YybH family protein [Actinoplanes sp. HUAS TT8]|uniref:YybH family protein n=1 Tax=Actinoplanes sp. HUAS TT8 TaxID=3447453 RepID=UPI003F51E8C6
MTTEVLAAAGRLVAAFGAHDTAAYFGSFAADATFVFHTHATPLRSLSDYEQIWYGWEREGFHVESCSSSDQHVQLFGDVAVFTHRVRTVIRTGEGPESLDERETIVFRREPDGRWLAVHEHLSPSPA